MIRIKLKMYSILYSMTSNEYFCEKCQYRTHIKDSFQKHLKSKKHQNSNEEDKLYVCKECCYSTNDRQAFNRHLKTDKHIYGIKVRSHHKLIQIYLLHLLLLQQPLFYMLLLLEEFFALPHELLVLHHLHTLQLHF